MLRQGLCVAVGLVLLPIDEASACTPDPCKDTIAYVGIQRVGADHGDVITVPTDGVVVMEARWFGELLPEDLLEGLRVTVTLDGTLVDGAVEWDERLTGVYLWRPAAALAPDATYEVRATYTNTDEVPGECAEKLIEDVFTFTTSAGPSLPLESPKIWSREKYDESPVFELDALICCDGAYPVAQEFCGIPQGIAWQEGECLTSKSRGRLSAELGASSILDDATASQWALTLYMDGEPIQSTLGSAFSRSLYEPACFTIERFSLVTGESLMSGERCLGEDTKTPLGDIHINPSELLVELCASQPYVCEINENEWVAERCAVWPITVPPAEMIIEDGCGCRSGDGLAGLLCVGLLPLIRRRRRA